MRSQWAYWAGALTPVGSAARGLARWLNTYNQTRLHSALGYLSPADCYRGDPEAWFAKRRQELTLARQRRQGAWEAYHTAVHPAA